MRKRIRLRYAGMFAALLSLQFQVPAKEFAYDKFSWGSGVSNRAAVMSGTSINNLPPERSDSSAAWKVAAGSAVFAGNAGAGRGLLTLSGATAVTFSHQPTGMATNGTSVGLSFDNNSTTTNFSWNNIQSTGQLVATFVLRLADDPVKTPYLWLAQHGLTNFETDVFADMDNDGVPAWQEYAADTDPTNRNSVLRLNRLMFSNGLPVIDWQGGIFASQILERTVSLGAATFGFRFIPGCRRLRRPTVFATQIHRREPGCLTDSCGPIAPKLN